MLFLFDNFSSVTYILFNISFCYLCFAFFYYHFFLATAKGNTYEVNFIHSVKHTDRLHIHLHQRLSIAPLSPYMQLSFTDYTFDRALTFFCPIFALYLRPWFFFNYYCFLRPGHLQRLYYPQYLHYLLYYVTYY